MLASCRQAALGYGTTINLALEDPITENSLPALDPHTPAALDSQSTDFDDLRARCPVARSEQLGSLMLRHDDVCRVLRDHETFSNVVSARLTVPNGMDPPVHTEYRKVNDRYFTGELMDSFEPACRRIAVELVKALPSGVPVDVMAHLAQDFALRVQSAFLGWPSDLEEPLRAWTRKNHEATRARDLPAMTAVAVEFDGFIRELLTARRAAGAAAPDDLTTRLLGEQVWDRAMTDDELVSLLRNWTVGELSTIAASVGILAHYLATQPQVHVLLRNDPTLIGAANDEILRIHAPLITNRRVTTDEVELGGHTFATGDRLAVVWASANRDEAVFGDPDEFRLDRDPTLNLLYGAGIHICPGAPLARLELRVVIEVLLELTDNLTAAPATESVRARYPGSGFDSLHLTIT